MPKSIHIVALDVPFPPNYGGVIDIYNRAKALKQAGWNVTLYCFEYGRGRNHDFSEIATTVFYYPRKKTVFSLLSRKPFIVASRWNNDLYHRLLQVDSPILLEGQHCSEYANLLEAHGKKCLIRIHNIEWHYYQSLAMITNSWLKKQFFRLEARKLKRHESQLLNIPLACISNSDQAYYEALGCSAFYLPTTLFAPTTLPKELNEYWLYHGNLSVPENDDAVRKICHLLGENSQISIKIAGKNPSSSLKACINKAGFDLLENPDNATILATILAAKGHLLISRQNTGIKLKLLHALATGSTCIVNNTMIEGTNLGRFCTIWDEQTELAELMRATPSKNYESRTAQRTLLNDLYGPEQTICTLEELINQLN
jgi:hypothetical protein